MRHRPIARLIRNGVPDGYMVRLSGTLQERYFPSATRVARHADGSIQLYNEWLPIGEGSFGKAEFTEVWAVQRPHVVRNDSSTRKGAPMRVRRTP
jgi:hypothetical protein